MVCKSWIAFSGEAQELVVTSRQSEGVQNRVEESRVLRVATAFVVSEYLLRGQLRQLYAHAYAADRRTILELFMVRPKLLICEFNPTTFNIMFMTARYFKGF